MKTLPFLIAFSLAALALQAQRPAAFAERQKPMAQDVPATSREVDLDADRAQALMKQFGALRTPYEVTQNAFNPLLRPHFQALDLSYYPVIPAMSKYLTTPDRVQFWAVGYCKSPTGTLALVYALQYEGSAVPTEYWVQAIEEAKAGFRRMGDPVLLARYISADVTQGGALDAKLNLSRRWLMRKADARTSFVTHEETLRPTPQGWAVQTPRHAVESAYYHKVAPATGRAASSLEDQ